MRGQIPLQKNRRQKHERRRREHPLPSPLPAGEGNDAKRRCTSLRADMSIPKAKGPTGAEAIRKREFLDKSWMRPGCV